MSNVGVWTVTSGDPQRLHASGVDLEKQLEDWIERNPSLIDPGLTIVGRQVHVGAGNVDLLAIDPQGRWVVIEIKKGQLRRDAVAQAIDYAACLEEMPFDQLAAKANEYLAARHGDAKMSVDSILKNRGATQDAEEDRETIMYLVGTGEDPGLLRMSDYLDRRNVAVRVVLVDTFKLSDGSHILVRELTESDEAPSSNEKTGATFTLEKILTRAKISGLEKHFEMLLNAAKTHDLYAHPYKESIALTPPNKRKRTLLVFWSGSAVDGAIPLEVYPQVFAEFFPISEEVAISILGAPGFRSLNLKQLEDFIKKLDLLFEKIAEAQ